MKDVELPYHFPDNIADQKRNRLARLGAAFILFSALLVPLLVVLLSFVGR